MKWNWFNRGAASGENSAPRMEQKEEPGLEGDAQARTEETPPSYSPPADVVATLSPEVQETASPVKKAMALPVFPAFQSPKIDSRVLRRPLAPSPSEQEPETKDDVVTLEMSRLEPTGVDQPGFKLEFVAEHFYADINALPEVEEAPAAPAPVIDYVSQGRTKNSFGHAQLIPASDERHPMWAEQRLSRGFDDTELWNLDDTVSRFILPRLKALREKEMLPPTGMTMPQWQVLVDKMITAFELLLPPSGGTWSRGTLNTRQRAQVQEGLDLFRQYFFNLCC